MTLKAGIQYAFCTLGCLWVGLRVASETESPRFLSILFIFMAIVLLIRSIFHVPQIAKADRSWEVYVTDRLFVWKAPTNIKKGFSEQSFEIELSDIVRFVTQCDSKTDSPTYYYVQRKHNKNIDLSDHSGVSMRKLKQALEKAGVRTETEYVT